MASSSSVPMTSRSLTPAPPSMAISALTMYWPVSKSTKLRTVKWSLPACTVQGQRGLVVVDGEVVVAVAAVDGQRQAVAGAQPAVGHVVRPRERCRLAGTIVVPSRGRAEQLADLERVVAGAAVDARSPRWCRRWRRCRCRTRPKMLSRPSMPAVGAVVVVDPLLVRRRRVAVRATQGVEGAVEQVDERRAVGGLVATDGEDPPQQEDVVGAVGAPDRQVVEAVDAGVEDVDDVVALDSLRSRRDTRGTRRGPRLAVEQAGCRRWPRPSSGAGRRRRRRGRRWPTDVGRRCRRPGCGPRGRWSRTRSGRRRRCRRSRSDACPSGGAERSNSAADAPAELHQGADARIGVAEVAEDLVIVPPATIAVSTGAYTSSPT